MESRRNQPGTPAPNIGKAGKRQIANDAQRLAERGMHNEQHRNCTERNMRSKKKPKDNDSNERATMAHNTLQN